MPNIATTAIGEVSKRDHADDDGARQKKTKKTGRKLRQKTKKIKQKSDAKTSQKTRENLVCFVLKIDKISDKIQQNA